ncbi:hypothetical protein HXX76_003963 [Chlamydomonas incerta]|uniref:Uncharacterized protein n=1 Tax=Chlamydomonas incerta TaxID=51695 RepID=A0A835TLX6_CHLIN|nr:hypothetical protein HXX76_003963 [Chlamydomonas incerta]|eukprot:KAG2441111.1 hypothetical protein HXX76_003963 [Chlamydomonas incerta]
MPEARGSSRVSRAAKRARSEAAAAGADAANGAGVRRAAEARVFDALPNEVSARVAAFLPPNEVATTLRLVSPAAAALYSQRAVQLSQPVPAHAFAAKWTPEAVRALTVAQKRSLVQLTARTGELANLEVALAVTQIGRWAALEAAASSGRVAAVQCVCNWLKRELKLPLEWHETDSMVEAAAAGGHEEILRWLHKRHKADLTHGLALEKACLGGHSGAVTLMMKELQRSHPQDWCDMDGTMELPCLAAYKGHFSLSLSLLAAIPPFYEPDHLDLLSSTAAGCTLAQLQAIIAREMRLRGLPTAGIEAAAAGGGGGEAGAGVGAASAVAAAAAAARGAAGQAAAAAAAPWWGDQGAILGDTWEGRFVVGAAAASDTPDWREKVEWLLSRGAQTAELGPSGPPCTLLDQHDWDPLLDCGLVRGGTERLAWLRDRGFTFDEELGDAAAAQGRLAELEFVLDMFGLDCVTFDGVDMASERGHLHILQALHARQYTFDIGPALESAARGGQLEVFQWLLQLPAPAEPGAAGGGAAAGERLAGGRRTRSNANPGAKHVTVHLINSAMEGGNLQLLQYALDLNPSLRLGRGTLEVALHYAADGQSGGAASLPMLDLLVQRGLPMGSNGDPYITAAAGAEGRPVITALARTYRCPWGPPGRVLTSYFASGASVSLSTLKHLLAEGCPMEPRNWSSIKMLATHSWGMKNEVKAWALAQAGAVERHLWKEAEAKEREREKKKEKAREQKQKEKEKAKAAKGKAKEGVKGAKVKTEQGRKAGAPTKKAAVKRQPAAAAKKSQAAKKGQTPKKAPASKPGAKGKKGGGGKGGGGATAAAGSGSKKKR